MAKQGSQQQSVTTTELISALEVGKTLLLSPGLNLVSHIICTVVVQLMVRFAYLSMTHTTLHCSRIEFKQLLKTAARHASMVPISAKTK